MRRRSIVASAAFATVLAGTLTLCPEPAVAAEAVAAGLGLGESENAIVQTETNFENGGGVV